MLFLCSTLELCDFNQWGGDENARVRSWNLAPLSFDNVKPP